MEALQRKTWGVGLGGAANGGLGEGARGGAI